MQIQHESQLIEPTTIKAEDFISNYSLALDKYTLYQSGFNPIQHLACNSAQGGAILAIYSRGTNQITLMDTRLPMIRRERFLLKSCDKRFSRQSFVVKGMDFSPDGTRLAIGQSDSIIYIYKIGQQHGHQLDGSGGITHSSAQPHDTTLSTTTFNKPVISGKFVCSSPVTHLIWTEMGIVFSTRDGKVKLISQVGGSTNKLANSSSGTNNNKNININSDPDQQTQQQQQQPQTKVINLYNSPKNTMPITIASKFSVIAVGFVDGSIQILNYPIDSELGATGSRRNSSYQTTASISVAASTLNSSSNSNSSNSSSSSGGSAVISIDHGYPPNGLAFLHNTSNNLCCISSDGRLAFYSVQEKGKEVTTMQTINFKEEIISLDYSATNDIIALITKNRLLFCTLNAETNKWQLQTSSIEFSAISNNGNLCQLTCLRWCRDAGSQLVVGTQFGSLESFKCQWNKQTLNDQLDICHIAKNRVRITDRKRNLLATYKTLFNIKRVNLFDGGQNVLIWTQASLLMAHLGQTEAQSEIKWRRDEGISKFHFHTAGYVIIFTPSIWELSLVKLGQDSIYYSTKIDSQILNKNMISASCYPRRFESIGNYYHHQSQASTTSYSRSPSIHKRGSEQVAGFNDDSVSSLGQQLTKRAGGEKISIDPIERFALITNSLQHLNLINLRTNTKRIIAKETESSKSIVWLDLSCTGKYLAWKNSKNRLTLMQLKDEMKDKEKDEQKDKSIKEDDSNNGTNEIKLDNVSYVRWLPETDILLAQSMHKIYIWYKIELTHNPRVIDSRSYNILKRTPLIDLSNIAYFTDAAAATEHAATSRTIRAYPKISHSSISEIFLSNGCSIPLDSLYIRFHREIIQLKLESAMKLLLKDNKETNQDRNNPRVSLWAQLGWMAINHQEVNMEIAIESFKRISHKSMVDYLENCVSVAAQTSEEEMQAQLAKLKGDWNLFERLQEPETVVSTYKRLNKWSKCIEYLSRTQQFRQKDLAEQELKQWLLDKGRYFEAAKIQAKQTGDLEGAIGLLLERDHFKDAAKLLLDDDHINSYSRLSDEKLIKLKDQLIVCRNFDLAAKICQNILDKPDEALDLFIRGQYYDDALSLATTTEVNQQQKVDEIKRQFGDKLMTDFKRNKITKRQSIRAIQLYWESGALVEAIEAAMELKEDKKALELLETTTTTTEDEQEEPPRLTGEQIATLSEKIASNLLAARGGVRGESALAIRAYRLGKQYSKVVDLLVEDKQFEEAFRVSTKHIHHDDKQKTREEFKRMAEQKMIPSNDLESAEKIYLLIGAIDSAIEMYRTHDHERMLKIVEQYQPESMESHLLFLAKQMEQEGKFEEAEKYLLRAGPDEWTNVVRMYRLANKWDGAYRIARQNCLSPKDPLLVQLAYFWAKSLLSSAKSEGKDSLASIEKARDLLEKELDCFREVLEFSCDNNNYAFAIELCGAKSLYEEKQEIVKKYAKYLEKTQDLTKAEEILLQNDQIDSAVNMYLDNDMYPDAIRVIEQHLSSSSSSSATITEGDQGVFSNERKRNKEQQQQEQLVELLNRTLIESANRILLSEKLDGNMGRMSSLSNDHVIQDNNNKRLALAQQMYLRAQRPDLAIDMYKNRGLWQEAIQLAQRFAPQLLESIERDLDAQVSLDLRPIIGNNGSFLSSSSLQLTNNNNSDSNSNQSKLLTSSTRSSSSSITTITSNNGLIDNDNDNDQDEGTGVADQFLQSRTEQFIRRGQNPRNTRQALGKLLSNLADGDPQNEASCLILGEKLAQFEHLKHFELEIVGRINSLTNQLFRISSSLLIGGATFEHMLVWDRFRNLLAKMLTTMYCSSNKQLIADNDSTKTNEVARQSERKLLALHYALLHKYLADRVLATTIASNQRVAANNLGPVTAQQLGANLVKSGYNKQQTIAPIISLLMKLSMSLLRYSDLLDAKACFLNAGFWSLVANRTSFARFAWSRLIELIDNDDDSSSITTQQQARQTRLERQLKQADCPTQGSSSISTSTSRAKANSQKFLQSLSEIRSWLIESLMENRASLELSPLEEDGHLESSLRDGLFRPCLVSGYPIFAPLPARPQIAPNKSSSSSSSPSSSSSEVIKWEVRQNEWKILKMFASESSSGSGSSRKLGQKSKQPNDGLDECIQFIERLIGLNK